MAIRIFGHRGASGYAPENTMEAFQLAIKQGADGVELDVQLTRDLVVIVAHDETIDRVSDGSGLIASLTLKEIKKFTFNATHPEYREAKAPTLEEVLSLFSGTGLLINIELKNSRLPYPGLEEKCISMVERMGMANQVLYSSFNHHSVRKIKQINPSAAFGLLYDCCLISPGEYAKNCGADALHPQYLDMILNPEPYAQAQRQGLKVNVWTVNDDRDMRRVIDLNADILITNYPDRARAVQLQRNQT